MLFFIFTTIGIIIIILFFILAISRQGRYGGYDPKKAAGNRGEMAAKWIIKKYLTNNDLLLNNVRVVFEGKETELDNVIINECGIFIIEVKNYSGRIVGDEEDQQWRKMTISKGGNYYQKTVNNPIGQLKRQIFILSSFLKQHGHYAWIEGYVFFINGNSPISSSYIIEDENQINRVIHNGKRQMDVEEIEKIDNLLSCLQNNGQQDFAS